MANKIKFLSIFLVIFIFSFYITKIPKVRAEPEPETLIDNVFTFQAPYQELENTINLVKGNEYKIHFEIVSPQNCSINVKIIDPEGSSYELFTISLGYLNAFGYSNNFPHVPSQTGNHRLIFQVWSNSNLNLHIMVENQGEFTFSEEMVKDSILRIINKMNDEKSHQLNHTLEENYKYDFLFQRVSSVSENISIDASLDFWIQSPKPNQTNFILLQNASLPDIGLSISTSFGTAINGIYAFNYTIYTNVEPFNLAFGIIKDYKISSSEILNETSSPPNNGTEENDDMGNISSDDHTSNTNNTEQDNSNSSTEENCLIFISQQQLIGTYAVTGGGTFLLIVVFYIYRKKNKMLV